MQHEQLTAAQFASLYRQAEDAAGEIVRHSSRLLSLLPEADECFRTVRKDAGMHRPIEVRSAVFHEIRTAWIAASDAFCLAAELASKLPLLPYAESPPCIGDVVFPSHWDAVLSVGRKLDFYSEQYLPLMEIAGDPVSAPELLFRQDWWSDTGGVSCFLVEVLHSGTEKSLPFAACELRRAAHLASGWNPLAFERQTTEATLPKVSLDPSQIVIDGAAMAVTLDKAMILMAMVEQPNVWIGKKEFRERFPCVGDNPRTDLWIKNLHSDIKQHIESRRGMGSRWKT